MKKPALRITLVSMLALIGLGGGQSAVAGHRGPLCDDATFWYDNNSEVYLAWFWINWSDWNSQRDYIARRKDLNGNVTYQQWVGGVPHATTTPDGYELYRSTTMQRAGYTGTWASMWEYAHAAC